MKIVELTNYSSKSYFAPPQTIVPIGEGVIEGVDFDILSKFLLEVEDQVCPELNKNFFYDGPLTWGLREGNIVGKYFNNFFKLNHYLIPKILDELKNNYFLFAKLTKSDIISSYIDCGINIMRNGEFIPMHLHDIDSYTYLTGIIIVKAEGTSTNIVHPCNQVNKEKFIEYKSINTVGKVIFFPGYAPHYVDTYYGKDERIVLAFDLILKKRDVTIIHNYDKRSLMEFVP